MSVEGIEKKPIRWKILLVLLSISAIPFVAWLFFPALQGALSFDPERSSIEFLSLSQIPGVSTEVLRAEGVLFENLGERIPYDRNNEVGRFRFRIPDGVTFDKQPHEIEFYGDAEVLESLVGELKYLQSQRDSLWADEVVPGAYNGLKNLLSSLAEIVKHPIKTVRDLGSAGKAGFLYLKDLFAGRKDPASDASEFLEAFYENRKAELAEGNGFDYGLSLLPQTEEVLERQVNASLSGEATFELLTLLGAGWLKASKASKASLVAKGGKMAKGKNFSWLENSELFRLGPKLLAGRRKRIEMGAKASVVLDKASARCGALTDPTRLRWLAGTRPENAQFYRLMFQIHHGTAYGGSAKKLVSDGLKKQGFNRSKPEYFHAPELVASQADKAYRQCLEWGIFDDPENLKKLARGQSPIIQRGPRAGEKVHVDHIVPISQDPRLARNMGNLRLLPESDNIRRGNSMDQDAMLHALQFKIRFDWNPLVVIPESLPASAVPAGL